MKQLIKQIGLFAVVGVLATAIDFGVLYLLHHGYQVNYLVATGVAFIVATVFNYWASMTYIFKSKFGPDQKKQEFTLFVTLSLIGLGLTELLMWFGVGRFHLPVMFAKLLVTAVVMVFNFVSRKILLEENPSTSSKITLTNRKGD